MKNQIIIAAAIAFLLLGGVFGFFIGKKFTTCPQIKTGSETTYVKIIVHDTVSVVKKGKDIIVEKKVVLKSPTDTSIKAPDGSPISAQQDTETCYSFDENQKDGAYTKCQVCSDSLPFSTKSVTGTITYRAPPESLKVIHRVDTVTVFKSPPLSKDWKTYVMGIMVAVITGLLVAHK